MSIKRVDKKYRKWIASQECSYCGIFALNGIAPHHERILGGGGTGLKPPDTDLLPLCKFCHTQRHDKGAITFWQQGTKAKTKTFCRKMCDEYNYKYNEYLKDKTLNSLNNQVGCRSMDGLTGGV